jgi:pimeloyl-ACP methyl ester carboxylesterase
VPARPVGVKNAFSFAVLTGAALLTACAPSAPVQNAAMEPPIAKPLLTWDDLLSRQKPMPDATVRYGDNALQIVDIWKPAGAGPHPAVVMIHGGCWQTAIAERDIMNWIADDLRRAGVGVWNIEYRGVDRGGGYPGTYLDVGAAADMFMRDRSKHGFATKGPVIAIGHSAGGHLALWLGRRPALAKGDALRGGNPAPIDLAISQGGLPDLRAQVTLPDHGCGNESAMAMAGVGAGVRASVGAGVGAENGAAGRFTRVSPPEMAKGRARELQFNNELDSIAPPAFGKAYGAKMVVTRREGHAELIAPETVSWGKQRAVILKTFGL